MIQSADFPFGDPQPRMWRLGGHFVWARLWFLGIKRLRPLEYDTAYEPMPINDGKGNVAVLISDGGIR